jgi:hypothetical protein
MAAEPTLLSRSELAMAVAPCQHKHLCCQEGVLNHWGGAPNALLKSLVPLHYLT